MSLIIIPAGSERTVDQLVSLIYGPTSVGKTTLSISALAPLLLDCEKGFHRAIGDAARVKVTRWEDCAHLPSDQLMPYKTIIVDTVGALLVHLFANLLDGDRKMGTRAGAPTQKGYGAMGAAFRQWLSRLQAHDLDVILLAHVTEEKHGEDIKLRPAIVGQSRQVVLGEADLVGLLHMDLENRRVLDFNPSFGHIGKNPPQWKPMVIPNWTHEEPGTTMGDLLADAKARMSRTGTKEPAATAPAAAPPPAASPPPSQPAASGTPAPEAPKRGSDEDLEKVNQKLTAFLAYTAPQEERDKLWAQLLEAAKKLGFTYDDSIGSFVHTEVAESLGVGT